VENKNTRQHSSTPDHKFNLSQRGMICGSVTKFIDRIVQAIRRYVAYLVMWTTYSRIAGEPRNTSKVDVDLHDSRRPDSA